MPFRKTSLAKRAQTRQKQKTKKKAVNMGKWFLGAGIGAALFLPRLVRTFLLHEEEKRRQRNRMWAFLLVTILLMGAFFLGTDIGRASWKKAKDGGVEIAKQTVKKAVFSFAEELPTDKNGLTNILLLGAGGVKDHAGKGPRLTDSILIVSIDQKNKSVVILSVPRDLWVETDRVQTRINSVIRDESSIIQRKLRAKPETAKKIQTLRGQERKQLYRDLEMTADAQAENILEQTLEKIFSIKIHRRARVNFRGFTDLVDALGGVDIVAKKTIDDPLYPDFGWGYDPFYLEAGAHHLDGKTALKFARSRHGSSDFDRAARQQQVLATLKEKATDAGILTSPTQLKALFAIIENNFQSNLSWGEIISLAKIADGIPRENILSFVVNNNPLRPGGFLVAPSRELYGGAAIFVPFLNMEKNKYAQMQAFSETIFRHRDMSVLGNPPLTILNGTNTKGLAGVLQTALERYGIAVKTVGNAKKNTEKTTLRFTDTPENKQRAEFLQSFLQITLVPLPPDGQNISLLLPEEEPNEEMELNSKKPLSSSTENTDIFEIVIGKDYKKPFRIPQL